MLISRKHNFIFIHIYKNAGTSITRALMPFAADPWQLKANRILKRVNVKALDPCPYSVHIKAPKLVEQIGINEFKSYFSFAVVRNPWDWQVSLYQYMLKNTSHPQHKLTKSFDSFNAYIRWRCTEDVHFQKDFLCSKDEQMLVDFIGKFETLEADFQTICSRIGIGAALPKLNVSNTKPWQDYYDEETKELIRRAFEPDIHLFEYDF